MEVEPDILLAPLVVLVESVVAVAAVIRPVVEGPLVEDPQ